MFSKVVTDRQAKICRLYALAAPYGIAATEMKNVVMQHNLFCRKYKGKGLGELDTGEAPLSTTLYYTLCINFSTHSSHVKVNCPSCTQIY